jgi:LPS-assembly lipoprotein
MRFILFAIGLFVLAGCGFHLRGPQPLAFSTIHIGAGQYSPLGVALRRQVALSGSTKVEEDPAKAETKLVILANQRSREILSLTATGRVREYELTQLIRFSLVDTQGKELLVPTSLTVRREYTFDDEQVLGKEQEELLLFEDMQNDLVRQMMRRLAVWRRP